MLDERKRKILQAIIDDYISTAEPIGSRTIARKYNLGISPATIRNEMSDLEILGYLEQPHTSAGRIPSAKGYRFYVDCLLSPAKLSENDIALIKSWYKTKVRRIDEVFQETAKILSRVTRNVSIVSAPQMRQCTFRYIQFLPLDEEKAIVVLVSDTGLIENKVIKIPREIGFEDLQKIAQRINRRLTGLSFDAIKSSLLHEIKREILQQEDLFEVAMELLRDALSTNTNEKVYLGGTTQLLEQPEFRDVDKVKSLLGILEEEKVLCDILHRQNNQGVLVTIGQENKFSVIKDCSMVQATYHIDGQIVGTIAVLGPTRMEYGKVMAVIEFMNQHLSQLLNKYKM